MGVAILLALPACAALTVCARAPSNALASTRVATRAPAVCADLSSFEKSFLDGLYQEEYLDKNRALFNLKEAMPGLMKKADGPALRAGIDEAREARATVKELKPFILALKEAAPELVTETDEAILLGSEQVAAANEPQPAKPPPGSFLSDEQFQALLAASKSQEKCWNATDGACPDPEALLDVFGTPKVFFSLLRNTRDDPSSGAWNAVRAAWPVLAGVPDDELLRNLVECRKEKADFRAL